MTSDINYRRRMVINKYVNRPPFHIKNSAENVTTATDAGYNENSTNILYLDQEQKSFIKIEPKCDKDAKEKYILPPKNSVIPKVLQNFKNINAKDKKIASQSKIGPKFGRNIPQHNLMKTLLDDLALNESQSFIPVRQRKCNKNCNPNINKMNENISNPTKEKPTLIDIGTSTTGLSLTVEKSASTKTLGKELYENRSSNFKDGSCKQKMGKAKCLNKRIITGLREKHSKAHDEKKICTFRKKNHQSSVSGRSPKSKLKLEDIRKVINDLDDTPSKEVICKNDNLKNPHKDINKPECSQVEQNIINYEVVKNTLKNFDYEKHFNQGNDEEINKNKSSKNTEIKVNLQKNLLKNCGYKNLQRNTRSSRTLVKDMNLETSSEISHNSFRKSIQDSKQNLKCIRHQNEEVYQNNRLESGDDEQSNFVRLQVQKYDTLVHKNAAPQKSKSKKILRNRRCRQQVKEVKNSDWQPEEHPLEIVPASCHEDYYSTVSSNQDWSDGNNTNESIEIKFPRETRTAMNFLLETKKTVPVKSSKQHIKDSVENFKSIEHVACSIIHSKNSLRPREVNKLPCLKNLLCDRGIHDGRCIKNSKRLPSGCGDRCIQNVVCVKR